MTEHWKNYSHNNIVEEVDGVLRIEEWRNLNVPHFGEGYLVSSFGRIKSLTKNKIRKAYVAVGGYLRTTLTYKDEDKSFYPHILVALTFIPNPENKGQVNHKKGIKFDNRMWSLEWATSKENIDHAFATGLSKVGEDHGLSKLTNIQALDIFNSKEKRNYLAKKYNVSLHTIKNIKLGKTWIHLTKKIYAKAENTSRRGLSNKDVIDIFSSKEKTGVLIKRYGISNVSINKIKTRKSFCSLTKNILKGEWVRKANIINT